MDNSSLLAARLQPTQFPTCAEWGEKIKQHIICWNFIFSLLGWLMTIIIIVITTHLALVLFVVRELACPRWLCRCTTAPFPLILLTLWFSCRCAFSLCYSGFFPRAGTKTRSLRSAVWHWACAAGDKRFYTYSLHMYSEQIFFLQLVYWQTFYTLTMHFEVMLQNSLWKSEEVVIYLKVFPFYVVLNFKLALLVFLGTVCWFFMWTFYGMIFQ